MDTQISRRTLTSGALWAVPTAAVVGTTPASAASTPPAGDCGVTPEEVTGGTATSHQVARMLAWPLDGGTYSLANGNVIPGNLAINSGWRPSSACGATLSNVSNILTYKVHNATGEKYLPPTTLTDANGKLISTGDATQGNVQTGGYLVGVRYSTNIQFGNVQEMINQRWRDLSYPLTVNMPIELSYTATTGALKGKLVKRIITMTFTIPNSRAGVHKIDPAPTFSGGWTFPDPTGDPTTYIPD
ncbi:hypothetical protein O6R08_03880 [Cutibacterium equinum]|uniref:Tat pathway signal sequence domain protein n=1 Tax=Cutibacterium equinum TaxID=3016342 RepID=A0ABY7R1K4_9ACTN|nr:hypothetical protein [Cutibacterium equinum]WCC80637.1 hypothetical protein O6R08_03880 [Cutibacterium equinum]